MIRVVYWGVDDEDDEHGHCGDDELNDLPSQDEDGGVDNGGGAVDGGAGEAEEDKCDD
jgi:hypothetical protein